MGDKYKCSQYWCIDDYWISQPLYGLNVQKCIWCKGVKTIFHVFMYFARRLKTTWKLWSNRLNPLELMQVINSIEMPQLFKPSNHYENIDMISRFYSIQYDNNYACAWFQTDKKMLQLELAHVSFVVRILSQPRTSKMIWMLPVDKSLINRMRSHLQQFICWWKSFNAVIWFHNFYFFIEVVKHFLLITALDNLGGINTSKFLIKSFGGTWWVHNKWNNPQI